MNRVNYTATWGRAATMRRITPRGLARTALAAMGDQPPFSVAFSVRQPSGDHGVWCKKSNESYDIVSGQYYA